MFQEADKFFQDMGLLPMTPLFWKNSVVTKPIDGKEMLCHASASDFGQQLPMGRGGEYRIKMCAEINQYNLHTIHHEMGMINNSK
jgi:peptidyl-dipeptidase A